MSNNVRIEVLLNAVDRASRPLKAIQNASKSLSGDIRNSQKSLRELNAQASRIDGFRKASAQLAVTGHSLEKAKQEAEALATQFKNTERPTRAQAQVLESAKRAAEGLQTKYNSLTESVKRQQRELGARELIPVIWQMMSGDLNRASVRPPRSSIVSVRHWRKSAHNRRS